MRLQMFLQSLLQRQLLRFVKNAPQKIMCPFAMCLLLNNMVEEDLALKKIISDNIQKSDHMTGLEESELNRDYYDAIKEDDDVTDPMKKRYVSLQHIFKRSIDEN